MSLCAIVTRPEAQATAWVDDLSAELAALGVRDVDVVALPLIAIRALDDIAPLRAAWAALPRQALVFFVSANAVLHFFAARPAGACWPPGTLAAAPGPGTAAVLIEAGVPLDQVASPAPDAPSFDSEQLWAVLRGRNWTGRDVLIVRGEAGRDWLAEQLRAAGAVPSYLAAYARGAPDFGSAERALLDAAHAQPAEHLWLFSSSEAVQHLQRAWQVPAGARALATHPRIATAAQRAGFVEVQTTAATVPAVARAVNDAARRTGDAARDVDPADRTRSVQSRLL